VKAGAKVIFTFGGGQVVGCDRKQVRGCNACSSTEEVLFWNYLVAGTAVEDVDGKSGAKKYPVLEVVVASSLRHFFRFARATGIFRV
jgi:hypothetical protein